MVGKVNQDAFLLWDAGDGKNYVLGVFDGHGRELGQLAGATARDAFREYMGKAETFAKLREDPKTTCELAFQFAHDAIQKAFRDYYTNAGWNVSDAPEGYLLRRRHESQAWMCVHGGTTGTMCAVVDGRYVVVANVGDSTAILCGTSDAEILRPIGEWASRGTSKSVAQAAGSGSRSAYLQLSQDHSPESPSEFVRMREFRPCPHRANHPELLFVYDTLSASKLACPPIFVVGSDASCTATNRGAYYKNVRNEWATLVAVPPYARYQDALAFTRSLGDFHLQTYGVSHTPEVFWFDLGTADQLSEGGGAGAGVCLSLCSDGVWDNWKFEEVADFLLEPARVARGDGSEASAEIMSANLDRARRNFGNQADNMTAITAYLTATK